jgi:hypothetical protein
MRANAAVDSNEEIETANIVIKKQGFGSSTKKSPKKTPGSEISKIVKTFDSTEIGILLN